LKKAPFASVIFIKRKYILFAAFFAFVSLSTATLCREVGNIPVSSDTLRTLISANSFIRFQDDILPQYYKPFFRQAAKDEVKVSEKPLLQLPQTAKTQPVAVTAKNAPRNIKITNNTPLQINTDSLTASPPGFLKEKDVSVLIVHTHTTESYTQSPGYEYTPSDTDRTLDKKYNMVRIGEAVKNILSEKGITVYHDTTVNDYPSYNGSYNKSAANVKNYLANYPSIKIVLDIHRDAIGTSDTQKTKYVCDIG